MYGESQVASAQRWSRPIESYDCKYAVVSILYLQFRTCVRVRVIDDITYYARMRTYNREGRNTLEYDKAIMKMRVDRSQRHDDNTASGSLLVQE